MPDADFARAREFGAEIRRRFATSLAETHGRGAHLEIPLAALTRVDHVILEEDCRFGQRVRAFRVEGLAANEWISLNDGTSIGHKRIVPVAPREFSALRLKVTESEASRASGNLRLSIRRRASPKLECRRGDLAADSVGEWKDSKFAVDLTAQIKDATQYRLRFVRRAAALRLIEGVELLLDGAERRNWCAPIPPRRMC